MTERFFEYGGYEDSGEPEFARVYFTWDPEYPGEEPDRAGLREFLHEHGINRFDTTLPPGMEAIQPPLQLVPLVQETLQELGYWPILTNGGEVITLDPSSGSSDLSAAKPSKLRLPFLRRNNDAW